MGAVERISLRAVTCVLGGRTVLKRVSIEFATGTISFVEGPNGAGKSSLLAVIGGGLRPVSGEVRYWPSPDSTESLREELGWLGHDARLYRDLTTRENVEFAARISGVDAEVGWANVGKRLKVSAFAEQSVATLSRGQRQRVALARALVHEPSVVLLDEPVTGLDAEGVDCVNALLVEERDRGAIVVVVSHTPGAADRVNARRIRIDAGRVSVAS